jgi:hypothetical protein
LDSDNTHNAYSYYGDNFKFAVGVSEYNDYVSAGDLQDINMLNNVRRERAAMAGV